MSILVVDDDPGTLRVTSLILEGHGYQVVHASSAEEAIIRCEELKDDLALVVTDLTMPGMNGRELAKWTSKMPRTIPVILMSGRVKDGSFENWTACFERPAAGVADWSAMRMAMANWPKTLKRFIWTLKTNISTHR